MNLTIWQMKLPKSRRRLIMPNEEEDNIEKDSTEDALRNMLVQTI